MLDIFLLILYNKIGSNGTILNSKRRIEKLEATKDF